jgi:hypothetical protein
VSQKAIVRYISYRSLNLLIKHKKQTKIFYNNNNIFVFHLFRGGINCESKCNCPLHFLSIVKLVNKNKKQKISTTTTTFMSVIYLEVELIVSHDEIVRYNVK